MERIRAVGKWIWRFLNAVSVGDWLRGLLGALALLATAWLLKRFEGLPPAVQPFVALAFFAVAIFCLLFLVAQARKAWAARPDEPSLRLSFDPNESPDLYVPFTRGGAGCFWHLLATAGGGPVTKCQVSMLLCEVLKDGEFKRHPAWTSSILLKPAGESFGIDKWKVYPDDPKKWDLCHVAKGKTFAAFGKAHEAAGGRQQGIDPGTYRVKVKARAKNAEDKIRWFQIEHPGPWDQIRVHEVHP